MDLSHDTEPQTVSANYAEGAAGEEYFAYQRRDVKRNSWVSLRFFAPHVSPEDTVVDYGCGTGWMLKQMTAGRKLGIEPNPSAREFATELEIETVASPKEVESEFADVVVSSHAIEHALSPFEEFKQMRRIVKPEGKVVILLPIDDWRKQRRIDPNDPNHHLYTWTPLLLSNLLGEAGLRVETAKAFSYLQSPPNWRVDVFPRPVFDAVARIRGVFIRYHQLLAVARPV